MNLQRVDRVLYKWLKKQRKTQTDPVECIGLLEQEGIYSPTDRPGLPLRNDLRDARRASGVKNYEQFIYCTEHLKFEQESKFKPWRIYLK